jgi:hypothetical protein
MAMTWISVSIGATIASAPEVGVGQEFVSVVSLMRTNCYFFYRKDRNSRDDFDISIHELKLFGNLVTRVEPFAAREKFPPNGIFGGC